MSTGFLDFLDKRRLAMMYQKSYTRNLTLGEYLFREGDDYLAVYIINLGDFVVE